MSLSPRTRRYALEWAALLGGSLLVIRLLPEGVAGRAGRWPVALGVAVGAVANLAVFMAMARTWARSRERVVGRWILGILGKLVFFAATAAVVRAWSRPAFPPYLLALGAAFTVFSLHAVVRLIQVADRVEGGEQG